MCEWNPSDSQDSPDRMDALVWAITELTGGNSTTGLLDFYRAAAEQQQPQSIAYGSTTKATTGIELNR
jgi:hypothetical protein